jgi:hypothetical protein
VSSDFCGQAASFRPRERARPRVHRHAPSRADWKKSGHGPLIISHVGREAHPMASCEWEADEPGRWP